MLICNVQNKLAKSDCFHFKNSYLTKKEKIMANFGDNLRNWVSVNWQAKENDNDMNTLNSEFNQAAYDLVSQTPTGCIRFSLIDYQKLIRKIARKTRLKNFEIEAALYNIARESNFFISPHSDNSHFGLQPYSGCELLFYANMIDHSAECATNLIGYWFEMYVLPSFEHSIKQACQKQKYSRDHLEYYNYSAILRALHAFGFSLNEANYSIAFKELCSKHGLKLKKLVYNTAVEFGSIDLAL